MAIRFRCPECRQLMSIATRMAGRMVRCPACKAPFVVPDDESKPAAQDESLATGAPPKDETAPESSRHDEPTGDTAQRGFAGTTSETPQTARHDRPHEDEPQFVVRRPETEFEEMDLTPMVDVTFLLLIFFMITASFSLQKSLEVPKPEKNDKGAQQSLLMLEDLQSTSIMVQIDERNGITVDYEPVTDPYELPRVLDEKRRDEQKFELVVEAHPNALHETVVFVVDAANEISMQRIRIATMAASE